MPLYEYKCQSCGEKFEVIQKFSDTPLTVHEKCGGPVERLISTSALKFKGTGWYVTDYAGSGKSSGNGKSDSAKEEHKDSKKDSKDSKKETSSSSSDSSATKTESKPSTTTSSSSDKKG
jgi:putative FmdB family regulatory protein